jgi:hypothetical protein
MKLRQPHSQHCQQLQQRLTLANRLQQKIKAQKKSQHGQSIPRALLCAATEMLCITDKFTKGSSKQASKLAVLAMPCHDAAFQTLLRTLQTLC